MVSGTSILTCMKLSIYELFMVVHSGKLLAELLSIMLLVGIAQCSSSMCSILLNLADSPSGIFKPE